MTIAICLLLSSFVVTVFGPGLLGRLTRAGVAPRLGVAAWLLAMGSVAASWVAAVAAVAVDVLRTWSRPAELFTACVTTLRGVVSGASGVLLQIGAVALAGLATAALASLAWRWGRSLLRARSHTHRHTRAVRMIGRRVEGVDAVVLDVPERMVYCAAGRPHTIVITRGALDALDDEQLAAVLCHERAHLAGRHHLLLAATRGLAAVLPRVGLFTTGAAEIASLLEMCADDAASRGHGAGNVLAALLALAGGAPVPVGALGAATVGVLARAERLAEPAPRARRARTRILLAAVIALVLTGPALTALLAAQDAATCFPWAA